MTPAEAAHNAKLMAAWSTGATIQFQGVNADPDVWWDLEANHAPSWNFTAYNYRIKPIEKDSETLYIAVTRRGITTNYAVILDFAAASTYPCDELLEVQITKRFPGASQ